MPGQQSCESRVASYKLNICLVCKRTLADQTLPQKNIYPDKSVAVLSFESGYVRLRKIEAGNTKMRENMSKYLKILYGRRI
jgi:hypothetical protein